MARTDQTEKRVLRQEARSIGMCGGCALRIALPGSSRCRKCLVISRVNYFRRNGLRPGERRCAQGCGAVFNRFEMFGGANRRICSRCLFAMRSAYVDPDPVDIDEYLQGGLVPLPTVADPAEQVVVLPPLVGPERNRAARQCFELSLIELRETEAEQRKRYARAEEERQKASARRQQQEAEWQQRETERRARREQGRADREAAQKAEQERLFKERERLLDERRSAQASGRAPFEVLLSEEFLSAERQRGAVVDLCGVCSEPYWVPYDNLVNWSLHWRGPPRCRTCYCPPLTARIRRENPTWTPLRVSHEVVMAIWDRGPYAWAVELRTTHEWWAVHERDYRSWSAEGAVSASR
jgi:hypothetical protein